MTAKTYYLTPELCFVTVLSACFHSRRMILSLSGPLTLKTAWNLFGIIDPPGSYAHVSTFLASPVSGSIGGATSNPHNKRAMALVKKSARTKRYPLG